MINSSSNPAPLPNFDLARAPAAVEFSSEGVPFDSMEDLETAHVALLDQECESTAPDMLPLGGFLSRAIATGRIIDDAARRREAQALIDFWAAKLSSYAASKSSMGEATRPWQQRSQSSEQMDKRGSTRTLVLEPYDESAQRRLWDTIDAQINSMPEPDRAAIDSVLSMLVEIDRSETRLTRRATTLREIQERVPEARDERFIHTFVEAGVLSRVLDEQGGEALRIASESLAQSWPRMVKLRGLRRGLRSTTKYWLRLDRHDAALIADEPLRQAKLWTDLSDDERAFVQACEARLHRLDAERLENENKFNFALQARKQAEAAEAAVVGKARVFAIVALPTIILGILSAIWITSWIGAKQRQQALEEQAKRFEVEKKAALQESPDAAQTIGRIEQEDFAQKTNEPSKWPAAEVEDLWQANSSVREPYSRVQEDITNDRSVSEGLDEQPADALQQIDQLKEEIKKQREAIDDSSRAKIEWQKLIESSPRLQETLRELLNTPERKNAFPLIQKDYSEAINKPAKMDVGDIWKLPREFRREPVRPEKK